MRGKAERVRKFSDRLNIRIPPALRIRMDKFPLNWSSVCRDAIYDILEKYEPRPITGLQPGDNVRLNIRGQVFNGIFDGVTINVTEGNLK